MSEELNAHVQNMFKSIYDSVDTEYVRPIKRHAYTCSVECLNEKNSAAEAERCTQSCNTLLGKLSNVVAAEVNAFKGSLDRCLVDCQYSVRREKDEQKARIQFNYCTEKCVRSLVPMAPGVVKALEENLGKIKEENRIT